MLRSPYIEIIGLAGSGKSTLRDQLIEEAHKIGHNYRYRQQLNFNFLQRVQILIKSFRLLFIHLSILKWVMARPSGPYSITPHSNKIIKNLKFRIIIESVIVRNMLASDPITFINDEGIIGKAVVLSLLLEKDSSELYTFLNVLLPTEMQVLFVEIKGAKAIQQMYDRKVSLPFWDEMDRQLKVKLFDNCNARYLDLIQSLSTRKGLSYFIIPNNGSKEELFASMIEHISN